MAEAIDSDQFTPEQWWNGHAHLAREIGSMAHLHREIGNTHPAELSKPEWDDVLTQIGDPLKAYADGIDHLNGYEERHKGAKEALELFANWFDHFGD